MMLLLPLSRNLQGCADARCPACGQVGRFSPFSSYDRHVVWYSRDEREAVEVVATIERVRCECGVTHALIPTTPIPYRPCSLMLCLVFTILTREAGFGSAEALRRFRAVITACRSIASDAGRLARALNATWRRSRACIGRPQDITS